MKNSAHSHPETGATEQYGNLDFHTSPVVLCDFCNKPFYENDEYYKILGMILCEDCLVENHKLTA